MGGEHTRVDHLHRPARGLSGPGLAVAGGAGAPDLDHLGGREEAHPLRGLDRLDGAPHPPTVGALDRGGGWDVLIGAEPSRYDEWSSGCP